MTDKEYNYFYDHPGLLELMQDGVRSVHWAYFWYDDETHYHGITYYHHNGTRVEYEAYAVSSDVRDLLDDLMVDFHGAFMLDVPTRTVIWLGAATYPEPRVVITPAPSGPVVLHP